MPQPFHRPSLAAVEEAVCAAKSLAGQSLTQFSGSFILLEYIDNTITKGICIGNAPVGSARVQIFDEKPMGKYD